MSNHLKEQIYKNMNLKETDELLEIWQKNDRMEWSNTAFEVIKEILMERLGEIPRQDKPIFEYDGEEDIDDDTYSFTDLELKIIDDENPPEFYDPFETLKISNWIEKAALASVVIAAVGGFTQLPKTQSIIMTYFYGNPSLGLLATIIAIVIIVVGILFQIVIMYFPLRALSLILKILMQMEFNSRLGMQSDN